MLERVVGTPNTAIGKSFDNAPNTPATSNATTIAFSCALDVIVPRSPDGCVTDHLTISLEAAAAETDETDEDCVTMEPLSIVRRPSMSEPRTRGDRVEHSTSPTHQERSARGMQ